MLHENRHPGSRACNVIGADYFTTVCFKGRTRNGGALQSQKNKTNPLTNNK